MKIFTYILSMCITMSAFSQSIIEGRVVNEKNIPIEDVNVLVKNTMKGDFTSPNGFFRLVNIEEGSIVLTLSKVGYEEKNINVVIKPNKTTQLGVITLIVDDTKLDEVVVQGKINSYLQKRTSSALRLKSKLVELPQNIQIVDKQLMNDQISFNLFDGISRNTSGTRRVMHQSYPSIYMRGYAIEGLRNGVNIKGYFGPMKDDVSFVERIEFVKGPASFMMGNTSLGGLYNVVTKKPNGTNQKSVAVTLGSFDTYRAELDVNGFLTEDKKLLYRLNLMGKLQGSHTDYGYENGYNIAPSFKYLVSDKSEVTVEYIYQNSAVNNYANYIYSKNNFKEFPVNTSYSDPRKDPINLNEHNVFINFNHKLNNNWELTAQTTYLKFSQRGTQFGLAYNTLQDDGKAKRSFSLLDNDNTILSGQAIINGNFDTGSVSHKLVGGLDTGSKEYFADWSGLTAPDQATDYDIYNPELGANNLTRNDFPDIDRSISLKQRSGRYNQKNNYTALYLHDELSFFNNQVRLSLAGRYTMTKRIENTGKTTKNEVFTPRVGLSLNYVKGGTMYAVYDQTFEENYGAPLKDGSALLPSRGSNIEFGIKNEWFNTFQTSLSVFYLTKDNITTSAGVAPDFYSEQIGESTSQGFEIDATGKILPNLNLVLNYAYTDAKVSKDKNPDNVGGMLPGAARHISNAWLNYTIDNSSLLKGVGFSLGYQWQKDRAAWPLGSNSILPDDFFSLDAGVSYKQKPFEVSLVANNLTSNYNYTGFYPGAWGYKHYGWRAAPLRNFRVQFKYFF